MVGIASIDNNFARMENMSSGANETKLILSRRDARKE